MNTQTATKAELVAAVKAHAEAHYNDGGWDVICECWDDQQVADCIRDARTVRGAIKAVKEIVRVYADRQADAVNSAF